MDEVLQTNIFFFITGIAVIVLTCVLTVALYQLIRILTSVRRIVERIEMGSAAVIEDFENLRTYVTKESFLARFFAHHARPDSRDTDSEASGVKGKRGDRKSNKTALKITDED